MKKVILSIIFILSFYLLAFAEIPIYCPHEKVLLYYYQKDEIVPNTQVKAEDFKPANDFIPQPQENTPMVCPFCGSPLNGYEWFTWKNKMSPVKMVFKGITLLTKDENDNFKFVPYDFNPQDWERKN